MLLRYVYVVFIGVLLALFIGVGIAAFYPSPSQPETFSYSAKIPYDQPLTASQSAEQKKEQEIEQAAWKAYDLQSKAYNKNVAIIAVVASIIVLAASLLLSKRILVIADGLLLGGLLTLIYALIRSFNTNDFKFIFIVVSIGLFIAIFLGYLKFIKPAVKN